MKKVIGIGIMCVLLISPLLGEEEQCKAIFLYSRKEWMSHQNLIDVPFQGGKNHFINSKGVQLSLNVFGSFANPEMEDSSFLLGERELIKEVQTKQGDPIVFSMIFYQNIKIGELEFEMQAIDKVTQKVLDKKILINVSSVDDLYSNPVVIPSSTLGKREKVDLNNAEVRNVFIAFEPTPNPVEYRLSYFQVKDYAVYKHIQWQEEEIKNTEVKQVIWCQKNGKFNPDGTGNQWVKEEETGFGPSIHLISDYIPIIKEQHFNYDQGRGSTIKAYSLPKESVQLANYNVVITDWQTQGEKPYLTYYSLYEGKKYSPLSKTVGVQYIAIPVYWDVRKRTHYASVLSYNKDWCYHVSGKKEIPCYKHFGHSSEGRLNSYDIKVNVWDQVVDPDYQKVEKAIYSVYKNGEKQFEIQGKEELKRFKFNETGIWEVKAIIYDGVGQQGEVRSKKFYIDQDKPNIEINSSMEERKFNIRVSDDHSGVKRWWYFVSNDDGESYYYQSDILTTIEETIRLENPGEYIVDVFCEDQVGNLQEKRSERIEVKEENIVLDKVFAPVYEQGVETQLYVQYQCGSCSFGNPQEVAIFIGEDKLVDDWIITDEYRTTYTYRTRNEAFVDIRIETSRWDKTLRVHEKSYRHKQSNDEVNFDEIVVSSLDRLGNQVDFKERIQLKINQDKKTYFSGEGMEQEVLVDYRNECTGYESFNCTPSALQEKWQGSASMWYEDCAYPLNQERKVEDKYRTNLEFENGKYQLPILYLHPRTGFVYDKETLDLMDGGRRWYSNPKSSQGEYSVEAKGEQLGVNQVSWILKTVYEIDQSYKEKYHIRFFHQKEPFPKGMSTWWEKSKEWIENLRLENPVFSTEIRSD